MSEILIEKIKEAINEVVYSYHPLKENLSVHLSKKLGYHYTYMANMFTQKQGKPIQTYLIEQRIERAKTMLESGYKGVEVSNELHFSSHAHFANQFKRITGITTTEFKNLIPARAD